MKIAGTDNRICAITAAMKYGTGLQYFRAAYPERFYDVGIAEQHAVTFAGGLASMGMIPVFAVSSTFLQRAYDQLIHDVAIGKLHVILGVDRAGIVGEDGETHQGLFDVPMLTSIPNTVIYSPSCYEELRMCMKKAIYADKGLCAIRYPRGSEKSRQLLSRLGTEYLFMREGGSDTLIITYGRLCNEAYEAQETLKKEDISCDILKLTKIFPLDKGLADEMKKYKHIVFFEESSGSGSISEKVGDMLAEISYRGEYSRVCANGFVKQASAKSCLDKLGLTSAKMAEFIRSRSNANGKT